MEKTNDYLSSDFTGMVYVQSASLSEAKDIHKALMQLIEILGYQGLEEDPFIRSSWTKKVKVRLRVFFEIGDAARKAKIAKAALHGIPTLDVDREVIENL